MKLISPLDHPHSGKAAILIGIAIVLGITVHEVFFLYRAAHRGDRVH